MSWTLLLLLATGLGLAFFAVLSRRAELQRMARSIEERERALRQGSAQAQLQHPVIDLSRCLGCGTCVDVCPEDGVLDLVHGQAMVVNGARCVGVSACERECPVGAITVTLGDLSERDDVPALTEGLEAVGVPGLFLAGEVTAHALIKTAVEHGAAIGAEVARRTAEVPVAVGAGAPAEDGVLDLCVVGAGPAGLACALEAKRAGLRCLTLEKEPGVGGTVAKYPRRKLVMTQPVTMPLVGRLKKTTYTKEQLMAVWQDIVDEQELPIESGQVFTGIERDADGHFLVRTESDTFAARHVCLAIGRRGVPRQLGVPGEELPKVAYSLMEASSYRDRHILVVGGGDSAVETALGLAEQSGNRVTLAYRKESFFRIRAKNEERIHASAEQGRVRLLFQSEVRAIHDDHVDLVVAGEPARLRNDEVFVMAGGVPPFEMLKQSGVSFEHEPSPMAAGPAEQGTGVLKALGAGFVLTLLALLWTLWHLDYYALPALERPTHPKHETLRPGNAVGLLFGIWAAALIVVNLAYLLRRAGWPGFKFGSLRAWMTSHVATGILALLCTMLHAAMSPGDTPGGQAFWALVVLLVTGAIGRYFYAYVPRPANGRELDLAEAKSALGKMDAEWDQGQREFSAHVRREVESLIEKRRFGGTFIARVFGLCGVGFGLRRALRRLAEDGRDLGVAEEQIRSTLALARRAHFTALTVVRFEDLRSLLSTWRYLHRWVAALMVVLVVVHVVHAMIYGSLLRGSG